MNYEPVHKNTCPECGGESHVLRTYYTDANDVARRRRCKQCDHRFWTLASGEEPLSNRDYRVRYPAKGTQRERYRLVKIERCVQG
jgi:transcriptional regulator NrdR family protein